MATVTLTSVWLTSSIDFTLSLQVQTTSIKDKPSVAGGVRTYAGGRQRVVTLTGTPREIPMTLQLMTPAQVTQLEAWLGSVLLLRDPFGMRRWVTFLGFERTQHTFPNLSDVAVTFVEVTHDEAV